MTERAGIEIIGMISTTLASEIYGKSIITGAVDPGFIARFARAHEEGGFDRVLVGYGSTGADGFVVTAHAAATTTRLGFLIAHRPGFVAPTLAARKAATLDHEAVGAGRAVPNQHAVEPAFFVSAGEPGDEPRIDRPGDDRLAVDLGRQGCRDHPDDLDPRALCHRRPSRIFTVSAGSGRCV